MYTSLENRKKQYRIIYEVLDKKPRTQVKNISTALGINRNAASNRLKEAFNLGYVLKPQIRKRSYKNMKEYIYLVNCENPLRSYTQYIEDMNVVYHAVLCGSANLMIVAKEKIAIEGTVLMEGARSDYHIAFAPNHSWDKSIDMMQKMVENFTIEEYEPKKIIKSHWNETIPWDQEDEILFREFKYRLRRKLSPIMRKNLISSDKIYKFLKRLPECCTVFTRHFPESISAYDPCLLMLETDYEDFIVDLFSQLPTSSFFFKVSDTLFLCARMERSSFRKAGLDMADITELRIPLLMEDLKKKGILKRTALSIFRFHWKKEL